MMNSNSSATPALQLGINFPIIQAPMAGGATTPALIAGVCEAGGMGALAGALLSPKDMIARVEEIRALTAKPFQINLFIQSQPKPDLEVIEEMRAFLKPLYAELALSEVPIPPRWCEDFQAQFEALLYLKPACASFTFDTLRAEEIKRLKRAGIQVIGTATHLAEAQCWQGLGADAICLQGVEAGGHRGTFLGDAEEAQQTLIELIKNCRDKIRVPLIAAGGIMNGKDIHQYLSIGADYVQMGTAFLATKEAGISAAYKQALLSCNEDKTRQTKAISGRLARGIENQLMRALEPISGQVPTYPQMNALTTLLRSEANRQQKSEWLSLWAGQSVAYCGKRGELAVKDLMQKLIDEWKQASAYKPLQ